ncbi:DUF2971 domain-containing protein [Plesiomonas shigelloides]|uniref:DUF2971 domain-containing protein n=1 Tax=Plesiomonas shigelloides TaxID=703 RepID=UPI0012613E28|nr:DUF2971 domain-containing protein [Plesiomonas shigelloides]KAB7679405.1 DUF2971 domain-containing protein [Plesiomonas shigelloides]
MLLWHYTSADVLAAIFSSNKPTLRASHVNFLNDSAELMHGLEAIKNTQSNLCGHSPESIEEMVDELLTDDYDPHIFSFSLSEAQDSLYQWLAYCPKERGVALGFDFVDNYVEAERLHFRDAFSLPLQNPENEQMPRYRKCNYIGDGESIELSWLQWDEQKNIKPNLLSNAMFIKHSAFHFEQEHRLFFHPLINSQMYVPAKFNGSKPYVEFTFLPDILKCVYISPRGNKSLTERLVKKILMTHCLAHVEVKVSDIPFRE